MTGPTAVDEDAVRAGKSSLDSDADIVAVVDAAVVDVVVVEGCGGREFDDVDEDDASICCSISGRARRREDVQGCKQLILLSEDDDDATRVVILAKDEIGAEAVAVEKVCGAEGA